MERTRWEKVTDSFMAIIKLLVTITLVIITGKFLYDFMGSKGKVQSNLLELKNLVWRRASDDTPKELIDNPLTDEDIEHEISKIKG